MDTRVTGIGNVALYKEECSHYHIAGLDLDTLANEIIQADLDRANRFCNDRTVKSPEFEDIFFEYGEQTSKLIEAIVAVGNSIGMDLLGRVWAQVHHKYESCNLHDHIGEEITTSFVFYVKAPAGSGKLYFDFGVAGTSSIEPIEEMLVLFSPYLKHGVTKNLSDGLRISIAGNFRKKQ